MLSFNLSKHFKYCSNSLKTVFKSYGYEKNLPARIKRLFFTKPNLKLYFNQTNLFDNKGCSLDSPNSAYYRLPMSLWQSI